MTAGHSNSDAINPPSKSNLSLPLLILALSAFAIGTSEFVIVGLLPDVAGDLGVSIPAAGWLVSGYALGVTVGAPVMAIATLRLPRKGALLLLMAIFVIGNLLCALSPSYGLMMAARIVTAFSHGAFFGIGAVMAADLAPPDRKASAIALMFSGLTLANVLGVPFGTALGHFTGWRPVFLVITIVGILALVGLLFAVPRQHNRTTIDLKSELEALQTPPVWLALATTTLFATALFTTFTYVAPFLRDITHITPSGVTWSLLSIGIGLTIGNYLGGRFADWGLEATLLGVFAAMVAVNILLFLFGEGWIGAEIVLFGWAIVGFAAIPPLQINVVTVGSRAPNLISTLNIGAFNFGNAIGAWVGGVVIGQGFGLTRVPLAAAAIAVAGVLAVFLKLATSRPARATGGA